jgi:malonate-semialdehyde dehydrogenase (acetylating)/methylmalonate-semialdehyde dehydrogenase
MTPPTLIHRQPADADGRIDAPIPVPAGYLSLGGTRGSAFADPPMRGEDPIRFFTRQKAVATRWPEPGREGSLSPVFPVDA